MKYKKQCERCNETALFSADDKNALYLCEECFDVLGFPTSEEDTVCDFCGDYWSQNKLNMCTKCILELPTNEEVRH